MLTLNNVDDRTIHYLQIILYIKQNINHQEFVNEINDILNTRYIYEQRLKHVIHEYLFYNIGISDDSGQSEYSSFFIDMFEEAMKINKDVYLEYLDNTISRFLELKKEALI